ncbi:MAG: hypothetical protein FJX53_00275 [Alphaproteobacteria bacterium]|nr:hypothetical protein [Alphaproteobacteria bacterium]
MIALADVVRSLGCAWRLAHFDRSGEQWIDATAAGFIKSFAAAVIVAPGWLLLKLIAWSNAEPSVAIDWLAAAFIMPSAYVVLWVAFPLVMSGVAEVLGRGERWLAFVVANNWIQIVQLAVTLPASVVVAGVGAPWAVPVAIATQALLAAWSWFVARVTLDIAPLPAALVVVLELVVATLIDGTLLRLVMVPGATS